MVHTAVGIVHSGCYFLSVLPFVILVYLCLCHSIIMDYYYYTVAVLSDRA